MSKPRMMKRGSREFNKLCVEEAFANVTLIQCQDCGGPVLQGYCCSRCGSNRPEGNDEPIDFYEIFPNY